MFIEIAKSIALVVANLLVTYGLLGNYLSEWQQSVVFWVMAVACYFVFIFDKQHDQPQRAPVGVDTAQVAPVTVVHQVPAQPVPSVPSVGVQQQHTSEATAIQSFLTRRFSILAQSGAHVPLVKIDSSMQLLDYIRYNLAHAPNFSPAQQMTAKVLEDMQTHIYQDRGNRGERVTVTMNQQPLYLRVSAQQRIALPWAKRRNVPAHTAQIGADENLQPVLINFADPKERCGAAFGSTGSGKSMLLRAIIMSVLEFSPPSDTEVYLIDLDSNQFDDFAVLPQVRCVASTEQQALAVIKYLVDVVNNDRDMSNSKQRYLFIDEFQMLSVESDACDEFITLMEVIAKRGRKHGVPWFVGTQDPTGNNYPRAMQKNGKVTLAGYTQDDSYLVDPLGITGASSLRGDGDFIFRGSGAQKNFKGFLITPDDMKAFVQQMINKWGMDSDVIDFDESSPDDDQPTAAPVDERPSTLIMQRQDTRTKAQRDADKIRDLIHDAFDSDAGRLRDGWGTKLATAIYGKPTKFEGNYRTRVIAAVESAVSDANQ